jgi:hypothetical protein
VPATNCCIADTFCCCCCLSAVCTRGNGRASTTSSGETFNHGTSTNPLGGETRSNWECIDCPTKTFTYTGKDAFVSSSTTVKPSSTAADQCVPINVQLVSRGPKFLLLTLLLAVSMLKQCTMLPTATQCQLGTDGAVTAVIIILLLAACSPVGGSCVQHGCGAR